MTVDMPKVGMRMIGGVCHTHSDLQTRELLRLSQGMSHGNWKVTGVSEQSVRIQQGPCEITLILENDATPGASGARTRVPFKMPLPRHLPAGKFKLYNFLSPGDFV